jgi:hypothetical protein
MKTAARASLALVLLLAVAAAFWWLDFRALRGHAVVESGSSAIRFGQGEPARARDGLRIYAEGGRLADGIAAATADYLRAQAGFRDVEIVRDLPAADGRPAIAIAVEQRSGLWTPLYARTNLRVAADYASDGDLSWRDLTTMATTNDHPGVWVDGSLSLSDTAWGLASYRGYERYLSLSIAAQLATALRSPVYETGYAS